MLILSMDILLDDHLSLRYTYRYFRAYPFIYLFYNLQNRLETEIILLIAIALVTSIV